MTTSIDFAARLAKAPMLGLAVGWSMAGALERIAADWDWLWIDLQHGEMDYREMVELVRVCNLVGRPALVRVASHEAGNIGRTLDTAADAVMVPTVDTPQQAAALVQSAKFAPLGSRSYGGRRVIDRLGGGYAHGDQPLLVCQIETPEGLANVDAIAAVEGVDALFFGADDLTLRWGRRMDQPRPADAYDAAWEATAQACRMHGKIAGGVFLNAESMAKAVAMGYRMIAGASVGTLLTGSSTAISQQMKKLMR